MNAMQEQLSRLNKAITMKCSVFIATCADGYIATVDGGVDWLDSSGNKDADTQAELPRVLFYAVTCCLLS